MCQAAVRPAPWVKTACWTAAEPPDCRTVASALAQKTARRESFAGPRRGGCCFSVAVYRNFKPRVLCIDDESAGCDFLRAILDESGDFLVETGTDAFAALDLARRFKPDVVMLDINMPGQDGFSVARQFREEPWLRHRPIIFYSGREDQAIPLSAGSGGPVEFLKKGGPRANASPFTPPPRRSCSGFRQDGLPERPESRNRATGGFTLECTGYRTLA